MFQPFLRFWVRAAAEAAGASGGARVSTLLEILGRCVICRIDVYTLFVSTLLEILVVGIFPRKPGVFKCVSTLLEILAESGCRRPRLAESTVLFQPFLRFWPTTRLNSRTGGGCRQRFQPFLRFWRQSAPSSEEACGKAVSTLLEILDGLDVEAPPT